MPYHGSFMELNYRQPSPPAPILQTHMKTCKLVPKNNKQKKHPLFSSPVQIWHALFSIDDKSQIRKIWHSKFKFKALQYLSA